MASGASPRLRRRFWLEVLELLTPGDRKEIAVVRRMFESKVSGMGERSIADMLNREGIPSPDFGKKRRKTNLSGKWCLNTVHSILRNTAYKGDTVYNKSIRGSWVRWEKPADTKHSRRDWIVVENTHEGIISRELFDRANSRSRSAPHLSGRGRKINSPYLLSGLVVCAKCGFNFHGHLHKTKYGEYRYYEDGGYSQRGESVCQPFQIPQDYLEGYALKQIKKKVLSSGNLDRIPELIRKRLKKIRLLERPDTREIDQKLLAVRDRMEHIKDSIEAGIDPALVKDRLEKLDRERVALEAEKIALRSEGQPDLDIDKVVEEIFGLVHRFDEVLKDGPILDAKKVVRAFVERFVVDPGNRVATCYIRKVPVPVGSKALHNNRVFTDMIQTRPPAFIIRHEERVLKELFFISTLKLREPRGYCSRTK